MSDASSKGPFSCGLDAAVAVVGGKWKSLILWALREEPRRFGELRRNVLGVSEKMLTQQLRELESDGVVHREVYREVPQRAEYSLAALGQSLNTALSSPSATGAKPTSSPSSPHGRTPRQSPEQVPRVDPSELPRVLQSRSVEGVGQRHQPQ